MLLCEPMVAQLADGPVPVASQMTVIDPAGDAVARRTDVNAMLSPEEVRGRLVDLLRVSAGAWEADAPSENLFMGRFNHTGPFLRLDVAIRGLVNPPGRIDPLAFLPFEYGPRPVIGFVEIDMDDDPDTGGETAAPAFRYLANIARFGGQIARPDLRPRVALTGTAIDDDLHTPPFVERSGEEFHLALFGEEFDADGIRIIVGDNDRHFEHGETWIITGTFFHRAHGYEPFAVTDGGNVPGEYAPPCTLRFHHSASVDVTVISLVFPLTNAGAAIKTNQPLQPNDQDPTNQASVLEALADLQLSAKILAEFPVAEPGAALIMNWADRDPRYGLNIERWRVTALLGTSYSFSDPNAVQVIWTDAFPNVVRGDLDGSGRADQTDAARIAGFISEADPSDGFDDNRVRIPGFAWNFMIADLNYDGFVDLDDIRLADRRGDEDEDGDVDLRDLARFQVCFRREQGSDGADLACLRMDVTGDGIIDLGDFAEMQARFNGPGSAP